jgi:hypothetical protein
MKLTIRSGSDSRGYYDLDTGKVEWSAKEARI